MYYHVPPAIDSVFRRIWGGRREIYKLTGLDPRAENIVVAVSPTIWAHLMDYSRSFEQSVMSEEFDADKGRVVRVFDIPVIESSDLTGDEIRFRSEVSV